MLVFKINEVEVSTNDFQQASFELIYDRIQKKYINRFIGYAPADKVGEVSDLLTANLDGKVDVMYEDIYALLNGAVIFVNVDVINNQCRVEIEKLAE